MEVGGWLVRRRLLSCLSMGNGMSCLLFQSRNRNGAAAGGFALLSALDSLPPREFVYTKPE